MTDADIDRIDRRLADRARPWAADASLVVASEIADAHAHAAKSLTAKASDAEDGRPTARILGRSQSYRAAMGHLEDLQATLTGKTRQSLDGLVRDARAAFYADSVGLWTPLIPEEFRAVRNPAPTSDGEKAMRGLILHGYDLYSEIRPAIEQAKRSLAAVLNVSSRRGAEADRGERMLAAWERTSIGNLSRRVVAAISDSSVGVHHGVGLLMLHDDVRPSPSL